MRLNLIKNLLTGILLLPFFLLSGQTIREYSFTVKGLYGNIIPHNEYVKALLEAPVHGAEFDVEFQTMNDKDWHQFTGFPKTGIGAMWLNLGNPEKLGDAFALYPYICFPIVRTGFASLYVKAGAGLSYLTKTYYNTNTDSLGNLLPLKQTNAAIGSHLNVFFSGGADLEIPLGGGFSLNADYTWNHMSNGSIVVPNSGLNLLDAFVGIKYFPNFRNFRMPEKRDLPKLSRKFTLEIVASGGMRQLYYRDNASYPIGSLMIGVYRPMANFYRMGIGVDLFYDGVYNGNTLFERTYLTEDKLSNKLRAGISWQHEIIMGRLTAGFDFGLYLYDPIKNLEPYSVAKTTVQNKPLIYPYNIDVEDGWLYTRAVVKYTLSRHLFISLGLKTHLQKAEFIEWGLGYRL